MPVPRPRFTVRWLMIAVAVVALLAGGRVAVQRWERDAEIYRLETFRCQKEADIHRITLEIIAERTGPDRNANTIGLETAYHMAEVDLQTVDDGIALARGLSKRQRPRSIRRFHDEGRAWIPPDRIEAARSRAERRGRYWLELSAKYDHAARYPWLPVAPDPPEPD